MQQCLNNHKFETFRENWKEQKVGWQCASKSEPLSPSSRNLRIGKPRSSTRSTGSRRSTTSRSRTGPSGCRSSSRISARRSPTGSRASRRRSHLSSVAIPNSPQFLSHYVGTNANTSSFFLLLPSTFGERYFHDSDWQRNKTR